MTTLLTFRDNAKSFYSRYDYIFTPVLKFLLALFVFMNITGHTGYMAALNSTYIIVLLALICAFLPVEFIAGVAFTLVVLHAFKAAVDGCLVGLAMILIFYCGYMRFVPKTGILVFLIPLFNVLHLTYAIPVILGFLIGPVAILPVAFGLILYNYELELGNFVNMLAGITEEDESIQGYHYILDALISNKEMLLTIIVFSLVILLTYILYSLPFEHSWIVAFCVGGIFNIVLFLVGSVILMIDVNMVSLILGSVAGVLVSIVMRFFIGVLDYQRTEILQFEDDSYYYYVKAIPKLSVAEKNENVKHINSVANR